MKMLTSLSARRARRGSCRRDGVAHGDVGSSASGGAEIRRAARREFARRVNRTSVVRPIERSCSSATHSSIDSRFSATRLSRYCFETSASVISSSGADRASDVCHRCPHNRDATQRDDDRDRSSGSRAADVGLGGLAIAHVVAKAVRSSRVERAHRTVAGGAHDRAPP